MKPTKSISTLASLTAGLLLSAIPAHALDDPGFETPDKGDAGWEYRPVGGLWNYVGGAGVSGPNGPWKCNSVSPDPLGDQFGFLQGAAASISQDLTGLAVGATYELSFFEAYRTAQAPDNDLSVILDEGLGTQLTIYNNPQVNNATWEARTTDQFVAAKESYTLTFRTTLPPGGGDRTTIIDSVLVNTVALPGAPTVSTLSPADDAGDVPTYLDLVVTFSKPVLTGSGNITIKNLDTAADTVIPVGDARVSVSGNTLTINPDANLAGLTNYAIRIEAGALTDTEDPPGSFAGILDDATWNFTTAATDTTAPSNAGLSPAPGTIGTPTAANLVVTFDEDVRKGTGDIVIRNSSDGSVVETIDVTTAAVTISGAEVTINPGANLGPSRSYYVEIGPGAIEDLTGNPFAGITGDAAWSFLTTAIYFVAFNSDADSGIDSANTYTHAIDFGNNDVRPIATINGVVFANGNTGAFPAIGGSSQTVGTGSSTIPNSHAGNDVAAPFLADAGIRNLVGDMIFNNAAAQIDLTGLTPGQAYRFRLYHRPWTIGPQRAQTIAFDTDGLPGAEHSAIFDEDNASLPDPGFATVTQPNALTYDYTLPPGQTTLTVNINNTAGGTYHLYGLTNEERVDADPPILVAIDPADDAVDVPTYTTMTATFSEGIGTGAGNITIKNLSDSTETVITLPDQRASVSGTTFTIDLGANLAGSKEFALVIDPGVIEDLSGNAFGGIPDDGSWTFTTGLDDFSTPMLVTLNPADAAVEVARGTDLVLSFDEDVQAGSGTIVIHESDGTVVETIDVTSGAVTANGTDLTITPSVLLAGTTGYYVQIDAGAVQDLYGNDYGGIADTMAWNFTTTVANDITLAPITGDADSGISNTKTYTHTLDFGQGTPGAQVNGVQFNAYNNAANGTLNFNRAIDSGNLSDHPGNAGHNVTGGLANLLTDMYYNGGNAPGGATTWTLSGLTPGVTYDARIYTRQWGLPAARFVTLIFDPDGAGPISDPTALINQDDATSVGLPVSNDAYFINYRFTAVAGEDLVITAIQDDLNYSWHLYGITNEVAGGGDDYGGWALTFPGADLTDPDADLDGDGLSNDAERLFGLDPTDPSSVNPISVPLDPASGTFSFTRRDPALTGMTYSVWTSTDLVVWTKDSGALQTPGLPVDDVETVAVMLSATPVDGKLFVQVRAATLFSADFEADDAGFTGVNKGSGTEWAWGTPDSPDQGGGAVTAGNRGSANCWGTNLTGGYILGTDACLRSPVIDLGGVAGAALSFAGSIDASVGHTFEVNIIEAASDTVIANLIPPTEDDAPTSSPWQPVGPLPLPPAAFTQPFRIEWRFTGNGDGTFNGVYLDDVTISETSAP